MQCKQCGYIGAVLVVPGKGTLCSACYKKHHNIGTHKMDVPAQHVQLGAVKGLAG